MFFEKVTEAMCDPPAFRVLVIGGGGGSGLYGGGG